MEESVGLCHEFRVLFASMPGIIKADSGSVCVCGCILVCLLGCAKRQHNKKNRGFLKNGRVDQVSPPRSVAIGDTSYSVNLHGHGGEIFLRWRMYIYSYLS